VHKHLEIADVVLIPPTSDDTCGCKWCCFLDPCCSTDGNHVVSDCNLWSKNDIVEKWEYSSFLFYGL